MRRGRVAEWILALFTTRERAASTVGDLLEDDAGAFSFWEHVGGTALSLFWRDVWTEPAYTLKLAIYAWGMLWVYFLCLALAMTAFGMIVTGVLVFTPWWPRAGCWFNTASMIHAQYAWIPIGFQLGRWIARRSRQGIRFSLYVQRS